MRPLFPSAYLSSRVSDSWTWRPPADFISLFAFNARQPLESKLTLSSLLAVRLVVPIIQYVFISLWISLVTLAFGVSFSRYFSGGSGFPLFWLSNFLAQWAAGMPMEIALSLLGPRYTAFFRACSSLPGCTSCG